MDLPSSLGKYEIRKLLGRGAMGSVYLGFDSLIERSVAIKVLDPVFADDATIMELGPRFRREAQSAGRLNHPNIVSVYEYCEGVDLAGGIRSGSFIVMEYVEGRTLKEMFDSNARFSFNEIARVMTELLAALSHAHAKGVVHRDIKPANLMLLANGQVKVADFGVARIETSELTTTGTALGTIQYMSPEQFMGQQVDGRTDVFSCGVLLYRFLTGEPPFIGSNTSIIQKLLNQEPIAPSILNRGVPQVWDAVVSKALSKQASGRFQTAAAFADAIRAAMAGQDSDATVVLAASFPAREDSPARVNGGTWSRRGQLAVAALVGTGAIAIAATLLGGRGEKVLPPVQDAASTSPGSATAPPASPTLPLAVDATRKELGRFAVRSDSQEVGRLAPSDAEIEQQAWEDALKADSYAAYAAFVREYPKGRFSGRARVKLEASRLKPGSGNSAAAASPIPQIAPATSRSNIEAEAVKSTPPRVAIALPAPAAAAAAKNERSWDTVAVARPRVPPEHISSPGSASPKAPPAPAASTASTTARTNPSDSQTLPTECTNADARDKRCALLLGDAYRTGRGVERNYVTALSWYRRAASLGDAQAKYEIGSMLFSGQGALENSAEAIDWVRKSAEEGNALAQNRLGLAYENSEVGFRPNYVLAVSWFRKAADQGNASAQSNLGRMYLFGRGVIKDREVARAWLDKSAKQGDAYAYYYLAWMYEHGDGAPKDAKQASSLYRQALALRSITHVDMIEHAKAVVAVNP